VAAIEIMFDDLCDEKREEIRALGIDPYDMNWDVSPLFILEFEPRTGWLYARTPLDS